MDRICKTCQTPEDFEKDSKSELRPYGPGGSLICFHCAFKDPEAEARTEANFHAQLDAAESLSQYGITLLGLPQGPEPL